MVNYWLDRTFLYRMMALLFFFQERLVYLPSRAWAATPADIGLPYEEIGLKPRMVLNCPVGLSQAEAGPGASFYFFTAMAAISLTGWSRWKCSIAWA